ncbi:hypothetical protein [Neobacillus drentensis]|uniref:hypothetical protein n=1 Tax=Neobacillus drentensis TaxID=220684 RepID=UPI002FFDDA82
MIGAEGTKTPAGGRGRGGSPDRQRKAKCLERKSTPNSTQPKFKGLFQCPHQ